MTQKLSTIKIDENHIITTHFKIYSRTKNFLLSLSYAKKSKSNTSTQRAWKRFSRTVTLVKIRMLVLTATCKKNIFWLFRYFGTYTITYVCVVGALTDTHTHTHTHTEHTHVRTYLWPYINADRVSPMANRSLNSPPDNQTSLLY